MSPIYEYRCPDGHVHEQLRHYDERDLREECDRCGAYCKRIPSAHHRQPDGIYSYAPNIGSPQKFERQRQAIVDGARVIDGAHDE